MHSGSSLKYSLPIRILHWIIALLIIGLITVGLIMSDLPKDAPNRPLLYSVHKSFGVTVLFLAVLRFALRLRLGGPPLPLAIPAMERILAQLGHYAFYGFMIAMPVSGYIMSNSFGLSVKWFGIELPKLFPTDRETGHLAADFHSLAAYSLIGLILLHVAGVVKHYLKERINLLSRMI